MKKLSIKTRGRLELFLSDFSLNELEQLPTIIDLELIKVAERMSKLYSLCQNCYKRERKISIEALQDQGKKKLILIHHFLCSEKCLKEFFITKKWKREIHANKFCPYRTYLKAKTATGLSICLETEQIKELQKFNLKPFIDAEIKKIVNYRYAY